MADPKLPATDETSQAAPRLPMLLILSCSAAWVIAQQSYYALPQLLDPIKVAFDRSDVVVTRMYGYELFVFAIVALAAAGPLSRFSRVAVALLGGSIAVAAGIVSALTDSYTVLVVCRILLGAGGALAGAAGTAAAASSRDPERVYAVVIIVSQVALALEPAWLEHPGIPNASTPSSSSSRRLCWLSSLPGWSGSRSALSGWMAAFMDLPLRPRS